MSGTMWVIITLGIATLVAVWYFFFRNKASGSDREDKEVKKYPVLVADNITGAYYTTDLAADEMPKEKGRIWDYDGTKRHALVKKASGKYESIAISKKMDKTPAEFFLEILQPYIALIMKKLSEDDNENFVEKYWKVLVWAGAIAFLLMIWSTTPH